MISGAGEHWKERVEASIFHEWGFSLFRCWGGTSRSMVLSLWVLTPFEVAHQFSCISDIYIFITVVL